VVVKEHLDLGLQEVLVVQEAAQQMELEGLELLVKEMLAEPVFLQEGQFTPEEEEALVP
jgi:hypothetical protein